MLSIRFQLLALAILINMNNNYTACINASLYLSSLYISLSLSHTHTKREQYIKLNNKVLAFNI